MANKGFKIDMNKKKDNRLSKENIILQRGIEKVFYWGERVITKETAVKRQVWI